MGIKKSLLVGATLASVSFGGVGLASAATNTEASDGTSLAQRIADKFNINKDEVQTVLDEDRASHQAEHEAAAAERLTTAVSDGTLTQEQADYITKAQAEIKTIMGETGPKDLTEAQRTELKTKMDALRTWAEENDIERSLIGPGGKGMGGPGMRGDKDGMMSPDDSPTESTDDATTDGNDTDSTTSN